MKKSRKGIGGRKALQPGERKVLVRLYVPAKVVESVGGLQSATEIAIQAIIAAAEKQQLNGGTIEPNQI